MTVSGCYPCRQPAGIACVRVRVRVGGKVGWWVVGLVQ